MKLPIKIFLLLAFLSVAAGCGGGNQKIKGIAERDLDRPKLPHYDPEGWTGYNYFVNGSIFETIGELYMARDQYAKALEIVPTSNIVRYSYAAILSRLNEQRKSLDIARLIKPKDVDAWILVGNDYRTLAIFDSAMTAYHQALKLDSTITSIYYFMAAYYLQMQKADSVIWAQEHIATWTRDFNNYQQLANTQLQAGEINGAIDSFKKSLEVDSSANNIRAYVALSAIYEEIGDREKALEYAEEAARVKPDDIMIQERLLRFYEENGKYDQGIETAKIVRSLAPDDKVYDRRLGIMYYRADSLSKADSVFSALIATGEENPLDYFYAGQVAFTKKDYELSKEDFRHLANMADTVLDGWMNLARVYIVQDSVGQAVVTYDTALSKMTNLDDSMIVMYSLAAALEMQNNVDLAIEMFETIIKNQPDNGLALNYLGYMLADRGMRLDYAKELILKALAIQPENGAFVDSYGWVLYRMGDYRAALTVLLQALEYLNSDAVVYEHIGDAYQALGDFQKAREYWGEAYKLNPDSESIKGKLYQ